MSTLPPPLAWVSSFCISTGAALGQPISYEVKSTKTPLIQRVFLTWPEPTSAELRMLIWNLFEIWAWKNQSHPQGRPVHAPYSMTVDVAIERRLGVPRDVHPLA